MTVKNKLAKGNLSDLELYERIGEVLSDSHGEPFNTSEVADALRGRGYVVNKHRIPDVVKNPPYRNPLRIMGVKYKLLSARSDYRMLVMWV
jgi:hypothetical protein